MIRFCAIVFVLAPAAVFSGLLSAEQIIDSFTIPQSLSYSGTGSLNDMGFVNGPGMIGGQREARIQSDVFSFTQEAASLTIASGLMTVQVTQGSMNSSPSLLIWDGTGENDPWNAELNGLGNVDFTAGGADAIVLSNVSSTSSLNIQFTMFGATGSNGGFTSFNIPAGTNNATFMVPFANFGSQADFTNVGALTFGLAQNFAGPATFSMGEIKLNGNAVPEPSALAGFLGLAVSTCFLRRR